MARRDFFILIDLGSQKPMKKVVIQGGLGTYHDTLRGSINCVFLIRYRRFPGNACKT